MKQLNGVYPISGEDLSALPVKEVGPAVEFYKSVLAFSVAFQSRERTLTDEDAAALRARIVEALERAFGAELRA